MSGWEGTAPAFTAEEEFSFLRRMKAALAEAFYKNFCTIDVNTDACRAAEAYAMVCAAETRLGACSKASLQAEAGDNFDAMQTMKRKLRAQFESATLNTPSNFDSTIQMARAYASLIESQAAQVEPGFIQRKLAA